jgi:hypothetical protein
MASLFLFLSIVGGAAVVLQGLGTLIEVGGDHDAIDDGEHDTGGGFHELPHAHAPSSAESALSVFNFRSIRAIASGICFTGLGGLLALRSFGGFTATVLALLLGIALYLFVAFVMRGFTRLEADHSVHPLRAVGLDATVSLPIPAPGRGPGKVTLVVAGRRVEWPAIQSDGASPDGEIASGTPVQIIDAADDTTLTVIPLAGPS